MGFKHNSLKVNSNFCPHLGSGQLGLEGGHLGPELLHQKAMLGLTAGGVKSVNIHREMADPGSVSDWGTKILGPNPPSETKQSPCPHSLPSIPCFEGPLRRHELRHRSSLVPAHRGELRVGPTQGYLMQRGMEGGEGRVRLRHTSVICCPPLHTPSGQTIIDCFQVTHPDHTSPLHTLVTPRSASSMTMRWERWDTWDVKVWNSSGSSWSTPMSTTNVHPTTP